VDALLTEAVLKQYWERWNEDNAEAIAAYNERIEREGLFSDRVRTFMRPQHDQDAA
jgi:antitoxin CcdA